MDPHNESYLPLQPPVFCPSDLYVRKRDYWIINTHKELQKWGDSWRERERRGNLSISFCHNSNY